MANCPVGSKDLVECKKLDTLKKEKNATKYTALKTTGCGNVSHNIIIFCKCSIVITVLDLGLNCPFNLMDF